MTDIYFGTWSEQQREVHESSIKQNNKYLQTFIAFYMNIIHSTQLIMNYTT